MMGCEGGEFFLTVSCLIMRGSMLPGSSNMSMLNFKDHPTSVSHNYISHLLIIIIITIITQKWPHLSRHCLKRPRPFPVGVALPVNITPHIVL